MNNKFKTELQLSGYHLESVSLYRDTQSIPKSIELTIDKVLYDGNYESLSVWLKITITFQDNEKNGLLLYRSIFQIDDKEKSLSLENINIQNLDSDQEDLILTCLRISIPYYRQNLDALTNDSAFNIKLPLVDVRTILNGLTLEYELSDSQE